MKYISTLLAGAALCVSHPGRAQMTDGEDPTIVVTGQGLQSPPLANVYGEVVIDRDRLVDTASGSIEDALRDVPGFSQFRRSDSRSANPSAQGANLRSLGGNASSRTLVLLDGVPQSDPFFGYQPYNAIAPERLSAVRVTRGGGVGAFGAGAVAGTIELISAGRAALPGYSMTGLYGSRDATQLSAAVSPDLGAGYVSVSGRWDRGDGFYTTPAGQRVEASVPAAYENWSASLQAAAPIGEEIELQARMLVYRDDRTLRFDGADSHTEGQDASIRLVSHGAWQMDVLAYVQTRNFSNVIISSSSQRRALDQFDTPATGLGGKVELRAPMPEGHFLRFGADIRSAVGDMAEQAYNAGSPDNPPTTLRMAHGEQLTAGAFAEYAIDLGRAALTLGARADRWTISDGSTSSRPSGGTAAVTRYPDRSGWETNGRAGVEWSATEKLSFTAAAYTGFRLPTLNELYRGFVVFPVVTQANADLAPERLKGFEGGVAWAPSDNAGLAVTLFDNRLENAISNVTIGTNLRQRRNVDAIDAQGVEVSADISAGAFSLNAAYAFTDASVDAPGQAFDGFRPSQTARHAGSVTLAYAPDGIGRFSLTGRYTGKQYEDDLETDILPSAITMDATANLNMGKRFSVLLRAENLFDEDIVTRNSGGNIDLGAPRTIWVGLRVER